MWFFIIIMMADHLCSVSCTAIVKFSAGCDPSMSVEHNTMHGGYNVQGNCELDYIECLMHMQSQLQVACMHMIDNQLYRQSKLH